MFYIKPNTIKLQWFAKPVFTQTKKVSYCHVFQSKLLESELGEGE